MSQNDSEQMELVLQTLPVFVVSLSISLASLRNQPAYGLPIFWKRLSFMPFRPPPEFRLGGSVVYWTVTNAGKCIMCSSNFYTVKF